MYSPFSGLISSCGNGDGLLPTAIVIAGIRMMAVEHPKHECAPHISELFGRTERHSIGVLEAIDQLPNMGSGEVARIQLREILCSVLPTHEHRFESIDTRLKLAWLDREKRGLCRVVALRIPATALKLLKTRQTEKVRTSEIQRIP